MFFASSRSNVGPSGRRAALAAIALCALAPLSAQAQAGFPNKPITLIVPFAAGGSTDLVARVVAEQMRHELGQMIIVDNRAGAGGQLGTEAVVRAAPDGYTIGMATVSTMAVNPIFYDKAEATNRQLLPLVNLVSIPSILSVHPSFPAKDFAGFVAELQRRKTGLSAPVPGVGSLGHLFVEAFGDEFKLKIVPVPYRGMGPAQGDVVSGLMPWLVDQAPSVLPLIKAGKLRPLAVAADKRLADLPQVPTLKELGHAELNDLVQTWFGLVVHAKTPPEVADRLRSAAQNALKAPETLTRFAQLAATPLGTGSAEFSQQISTQLARNRAIAKRAAIQVD